MYNLFINMTKVYNKHFYSYYTILYQKNKNSQAGQTHIILLPRTFWTEFLSIEVNLRGRFSRKINVTQRLCYVAHLMPNDNIGGYVTQRFSYQMIPLKVMLRSASHTKWYHWRLCDIALLIPNGTIGTKCIINTIIYYTTLFIIEVKKIGQSAQTRTMFYREIDQCYVDSK